MTIKTHPTNEAPKAIFMVGGPGAGKSHTRNQVFPNLPVVDCDSWKERHPDYDPKNPGTVHEWSRTQIVREFFGRLSMDQSFVYDGTGTNAERYVDWMLKAQSAGFTVVLFYVRCPLQTALKRNQERERVVPEAVVREKHAVVDTTFQILKGYADEVVEVENS